MAFFHPKLWKLQTPEKKNCPPPPPKREKIRNFLWAKKTDIAQFHCPILHIFGFSWAHFGPSFHSPTFSLPFLFFLSETGERRRRRLRKPEQTHGGSAAFLEVMCFPYGRCLRCVRSNVLGATFSIMPYCVSGLDTLRMLQADRVQFRGLESEASALGRG
jgi:hypothetical protein